MTGPSAPDSATAHVLGVVGDWEFGCCAPRPVVGGTTWWRWIFSPHLDPTAAPPDDATVFTHGWSIRSSKALASGTAALELRSGDVVAWWLSDENGDFAWRDPVLGRIVSSADTLVGRTMALRGRLSGGRHGGGPDDELPYVGTRVVGLTVIGSRWRIENDRSRSRVGPTARRDPTGPPHFRCYPESEDPAVEVREDALAMEMQGLAPNEAERDRRRQIRQRTLPVDDLRALLTAVEPVAPGTVLTATRQTAERTSLLPPGFRPPRHPHEWTSQDTDLLNGDTVTTLHRHTVFHRLGPTAAHPDGAEREEYPDGTPLMIRSGRRRWRFFHWATDPFRVPADPELTAVESTAREPVEPVTPPRPTGWRAVVDGEDPVGEIRAVTAFGRSCWTYTLPGPERTPWAVSRVLIDVETGWLVAESQHGGCRQLRWSDFRIDGSPHADGLSAFTWNGPSRPIEWFRRC